MRKRTLKIGEYQPSKKLELKPVETQKTAILGLKIISIGGTVFFLVLMVLFKNFWLPFILGAILLLTLWMRAKPHFLQRVVFQSDKMIVEYNAPFSNRSHSLHQLSDGFYWFADFNKNPALIKVGVNEKIVLEFNLEALETLPEITEKVATLVNLEMLETNTLKTSELIRFKKKGQAIAPKVPQHIVIQKQAGNIKILIDTDEGFDIDLNRNDLKIKRYEGGKTIDLAYIQTLYYWIGFEEKNGKMDFHLFYLIKGTTNLKTLLDVTINLEFSEFSEIRFRKEVEELLDVFRNEAGLQHIEVREMKY